MFNHFSTISSSEFTCWVYEYKYDIHHPQLIVLSNFKTKMEEDIINFLIDKKFYGALIRNYEFNAMFKVVKITFDVPASKKCLENLKKYYSDYKNYKIIDLEE